MFKYDFKSDSALPLSAVAICSVGLYAAEHLRSTRLVHLVAVDLLLLLIRPPLRDGRCPTRFPCFPNPAYPISFIVNMGVFYYHLPS